MRTRQELRADDRVDVLLPVQLWGMESEWEPFTEKVEIANVSLSGARMKGIQAQLGLGDVIAVQHAGKKAAFQVVWVGKKGSAHEGEAGIFCLEPAKLIWGTILLSPEMAVATSWTSLGSHVAPMAIDTGNIVVGRSAQQTPCRHWFHWSARMLNRSTVVPRWLRSMAFSSRVRREIRSWTRFSSGWFASA